MITASDYLTQMQALLPSGPAWTREPTAVLTLLLLALAEEFARIDARAMTLIEEADPRTTVELLTDWERVAGLPDPCLPAPGTTQARRDALVARITAQGRADAAYFVELATQVGFAVTVTEPALHTMQINGALNTIKTLTCNGTCTEPLRNWGNDDLECLIKSFAPAHVVVLFAYV